MRSLMASSVSFAKGSTPHCSPTPPSLREGTTASWGVLPSGTTLPYVDSTILSVLSASSDPELAGRIRPTATQVRPTTGLTGFPVALQIADLLTSPHHLLFVPSLPIDCFPALNPAPLAFACALVEKFFPFLLSDGQVLERRKPCEECQLRGPKGCLAKIERPLALAFHTQIREYECLHRQLHHLQDSTANSTVQYITLRYS